MTNTNLGDKWRRSAPTAASIAGGPSVPLAKPQSTFARRTRSVVGSALKSTLRNKRLFLADLLLSACALVLAVWFRFGSGPFADERLTQIGALTGIFLICCAVTFPAAGLYKRKWRYASIMDYAVLVQSILVASLFLVTFVFVYSGFTIIPHSIFAIEIVVLTILLSALRLAFRQEDFRRLLPTRAMHGLADLAQSKVPVLLVGSGPEADIYLRALQRDQTSLYVPVGFLDGSPLDIGTMLRGVPVLGTLDDFETVVAQLHGRGLQPRHLIFTGAPSAFDGKSAELLIQKAERMAIAVSRLNPPTELRYTRNAGAFELRPIELTDLLERPQASLDGQALQRFIHGRRVLITGAGGSIGSELTRQIAALNPSHIFLVDHSEFNLYSIDLDLAESFPAVSRSAHLCDVRDPKRIDDLFAKGKPELVFHAAALKHVPMVELNPCEGVLTNVCGTRNIAAAVGRHGALGMVQISTDKVVHALSIMGATKRLAELYCQALDLVGATDLLAPRFVTVRFGNVLGSSGSLIPLFKRQLARGGPLTVTHPDMTRFFMTIREAVELTLQASAYAVEKRVGSGEIFVLDMGEPIKIMDIARRMIRLAGLTPDRDIQIKVIGCRPGEKLFEELFDENEKRVDPSVPGVFGAIPTPVPLDVLDRDFAILEASALAGNAEDVVATIRRLIPGFRNESDGKSAADPVEHIAAE